MGPVIKLLQAIRGLTKSGGIKKLEDAYRLAQRELGERFSQYQNQIKDAFDQGQKEITKITNKPTAEIIPFRKKEGIESLSKGRIKDKGEVIEASFKPGKDKYGRVVEESPSQAPGTSPVMQRLEKGIETLKEMKQPGMDLTTGLTRTSVRKILDRAGIQVPDKVDPIEVFEKNFGGDALMDVKDVAEEMIELERMGKSLKSMDEILEQSGMFNIKRNPDAPKGLSDEEIERIKKEVDQEKQIKDFDPTDRKPNSDGGINRTMYAVGSGVKLAKFLARKGKSLKEEIKKAVDNIFTTDDIKYDADVAVDTMFEELGVDRDMFDQKDVLDAYGMAYDELKIPLLQKLEKPTKSIESMKKTGSINISDPEIASEMDRFAKKADPEGYKKMEEAMKKAADEAQPIEYALGIRKKNSKGGLQYLMGM
jgi:hypothetical protein